MWGKRDRFWGKCVFRRGKVKNAGGKIIFLFTRAGLAQSKSGETLVQPSDLKVALLYKRDSAVHRPRRHIGRRAYWAWATRCLAGSRSLRRRDPRYLGCGDESDRKPTHIHACARAHTHQVDRLLNASVMCVWLEEYACQGPRELRWEGILLSSTSSNTSD